MLLLRKFCRLTAFRKYSMTRPWRSTLLDSVRSKFGSVVGPLHSLRVSLQDPFRVDGVETAVGYLGWLGTEDTAAMQSLLGALQFVKTNVSMDLVSW